MAEVADAHDVSMTEVSLAWLLTKIASPVVGATKPHYVEGAAAADLKLTDDEVTYFEELYVPHVIVGVMAQNTAQGYKVGRFRSCAFPANLLYESRFAAT